MLFNSTEFILFFLPCVLLLFFQIGRTGHERWAIAWLLAASLFFYSWWNPPNLIILLGSILFNYGVGAALVNGSIGNLAKRGLLTIGIIINLALIGYFKYANFLVEATNEIAQTNFYLNEIILPLGISFFTFQQIAFLIDSYRGQVEHRYRFLDYCLFVTFFPHLIAGPLLHHKEIISQFTNRSIFRCNITNLAAGITIFAVGLFKKTVFADSVATYATQIFDAAADGDALTLVEAWIGALGYSLQLYFDFSGYCDMAIGIARMFGIQLPINFNSPYKSVSIIDFWRRWHITLSHYLRDYLYIPLGGNRRGELRRNANLLITMLLGGLWHGAGWTFLVWGGLHGLYLVINHQWRSFRRRVLGQDLDQSSGWGRGVSWGITFVAIVVGWVIFRANDMSTAIAMLQGMCSVNGVSLPAEWADGLAFLQNLGVKFEGLMPNLTIEVTNIDDTEEIAPGTVIARIAGLLIIAWFFPNTQQWIKSYDTAQGHVPALLNGLPLHVFPFNRLPLKEHWKKLQWEKLWEKLQWQPTQFWAVISAIFTAVALLNLAKVSEFLYFEF